MYTEKGPDIPPAIASFMEHQFRCIAGCAPGTYPKLNYRLFLDHLTWYPNAQLLLICRQVRMEASLMFFQCHDFSFSDAYTLCHFLRGLDTSARKSISKLGLHCYGQHRDRGVASGPNGGLYWLTIEPYQTEFNLIYALRLLRECTGLKELDISISAWELEVWVSPLNRWRNSISPSLRLTNALEVVMQETPTMAEYGYGLRALNQETRLDWGNWRDNVIGRAREEFLECIRFSRDKGKLGSNRCVLAWTAVLTSHYRSRNKGR